MIPQSRHFQEGRNHHALQRCKSAFIQGNINKIAQNQESTINAEGQGSTSTRWWVTLAVKEMIQFDALIEVYAILGNSFVLCTHKKTKIKMTQHQEESNVPC